MEYMHKVLKFTRTTGCIPAGVRGCVFSVEGDYFWVCFEIPILGYRNLKVHRNVIQKHSVMLDY